MSMTAFSGDAGYDAAQLRDEVDQLAGLDVTWMPVEVVATTRAQWRVKVDQLASDLGLASGMRRRDAPEALT